MKYHFLRGHFQTMKLYMVNMAYSYVQNLFKMPLLWIFENYFHAVCNTALCEWKHPAKF